MLRHVVQSIRTATTHLTSLEIARTFIERRGLDHDAVITVRKWVNACFWRLKQQGFAVEVPLEGEYRGWRIKR
jgi:hypothetical protein